MRPDKKLDKVEKKIEEIWINNVYEDITNDWIFFEADMCSSLYHHLRTFFKENEEFSEWKIIQQREGRDFVIYEGMDRDKNAHIYMECKHISPDYIRKVGFTKKGRNEIEKDLEGLLNNESKKNEDFFRNNPKVKRYFMYINFSCRPFFKCKNCGNLYKIDSPSKLNCPKCGGEGDKVWFFREFIEDIKKNKESHKNYESKLKVFYAYLLRPLEWNEEEGNHSYYKYHNSPDYKEKISKELFGYEFI